MRAHQIQRNFCETAAQPILNAACKEDPAKLGKFFNAVNLDIWDFDEQTRTPLHTIPNFVQGDVLDMPFEDEKFGSVVLGEFLEHVMPHVALDALTEIKRVLKPEGQLLLTFPLDDRPAGVQHAKHLLKIIVPGTTGHDITVWHQTVWTDEMLETLFKGAGFEVVSRDPVPYAFVKNQNPNGWAIVLKKLT